MLINVIGGSGFIGTRLCSLLIKTSKPFKIFDKSPSKSFPEQTLIGDVRSKKDLRKNISQESIIINLAAEHRDDVQPISLYEEVNAQGAKNICDIAEEKKIKTIIFTSSVAVYGFAIVGTDESGEINPFNDYGRTKYEAENIYRVWQATEPTKRKLVIVRSTVVFGEKNRGNVYNLLNQIATNRFVMIGDGSNVKSMTYVENITSFIEYSLKFNSGVHVFNFIDEPNLTMNRLVSHVKSILGRPEKIVFRLPYIIGLKIGKVFDLFAALTGKKYTISSIRVKKFCSNSAFKTNVSKTGFIPPVSLEEGLKKTVQYEFLDDHEHDEVFFSE